MEEHMARISSISSIVPESAPHVYIPPILTYAQQTAMSVLFEDHLGRTMKNWNIFPATDPIWKRCMTILLAEFQQSASLASAEGAIAERAVEVLTQYLNSGAAKRFFCRYL